MDVPPGVQRDCPLSRPITIRTAPTDEVRGPLGRAGADELEVGVAGSGSNLVIADVGIRGLVLKLAKELSEIELDGTRNRCGGGARLPAASARAAWAGLTGTGIGIGIEFGAGSPATLGSEDRR